MGQPGQPFPPYPMRSSRLSVLAVVSVLFGAGGMMACCCFPIAIPAALLSVVTGHTALILINRADSYLTGKPIAALGLVTGYLGLILSGGFVIMGLFTDRKEADAPADEEPAVAAVTANGNLNVVEDKIRVGSRGIAHGNTEEAKALAQQYAEAIQVLREEMFSEGNDGISLSGGKFITYCELRPGMCAFVVHVPEYRRFEGDAKRSLAKLAWIVGQQTASDKLKPGDKLAVALKGVVFYGSVMVGKIPDGEGDETEPEIDGASRNDLLPFFEPETAADDNADEPAEAIRLPDEPADAPPESEPAASDPPKAGGTPEADAPSNAQPKSDETCAAAVS